MFTAPSDKLYVKIADTPYKQYQGLMYVENLPKDCGMLFIFSSSQKLSFWGENTYIPLDIAFADNEGIIKDIKKISPLSKKNVSSETSCKYAIEANDNYFNENSIRIGDMIVIDNEDGNDFVSFKKQTKKKIDNPIKFSSNNRIVIGQNVERNMVVVPEQPVPTQSPIPTSNQTTGSNLPVLNISDLNQILEDEIDMQGEAEQPIQEEIPEQPTEEEIAPPEVQGAEIPPEDDLRNRSFSSIGEAIQASIVEHQIMTIEYTTTRKSNGHGGMNIGKRDIEPHGVFTSAPQDDTPHEILVTYDETVGDIRAFRITNITKYDFLPKRFQPKFRLGGG